MRHILLAAAVCCLALPAAAQTFKAQMDGKQEVPPKQTNGTGNATVTLDGDKITYEVEYSGLTGPATMAHIHGPAEPGANAGVNVPFTPPGQPDQGHRHPHARSKWPISRPARNTSTSTPHRTPAARSAASSAPPSSSRQ